MSDVTGLEGWTHPLGAVPERGLSVRREATAAERRQLAEALDILALDSLVATYELRPRRGGRVELTGGIAGEVVQACVVSLEPVRSRIEGSLDCVFVPPSERPAPQEAEEEALAAEDVELIEGQDIDVGRIVYEVVSAELPPYPRHPDATFEAETINPEPSSASPFAVLRRLKQDAGDD